MTNTDRLSTIATLPVDKYGENVHILYKIDLTELIRFPDLINEARGDSSRRSDLCATLRAHRVAKTLMRDLGLMPSGVGGGADCTGRWFTIYAEVAHVDVVYQYAIIKVSRGIDN